MPRNDSYVFLGIQGSGKGTQAQRISARLHIPHISTGDMLRAQVQLKSPLGLQAKSHLDKGELVPDTVIIPMLSERIAAADCQPGFILDGFPRNVSQARELDRILGQQNRELGRALLIDLKESVLFDRLTQRWMCRYCNTIYNTISLAPRVKGICDKCGGELYQRSDDLDQQAIAERIEQFHTSTDPVIAYYQDHEVLSTVDGSLPIDDVYSQIVEVLGLDS
jgi:adenylate kinase